MNRLCTLPKILYTSFRISFYPSATSGRIFHIAKRTCVCKSFCFCLIKLDLKLQQRGRPLKELRGRHVVSIQFFAL